MDQNQLKTTWKQRIIIGIIAFLLLFSTVAVYALIVLSNEKKEKTNADISEEMTKIQEEIEEKRTEIEGKIANLSGQYYDKLNGYRSMVRSFNAAAANDAGLMTNDLEIGDGAEINSDSSYYSYYIGWCADESVFESSFDSWDNPTMLIDPILFTAGETSFIAGWEEGVIGMRIGGVREIDVPGELAYGESKEICGGTNSPLKYIVMAVDPGEDYTQAINEYNNLVNQYYTLYYSQNQDLLTNSSSSSAE